MVRRQTHIPLNVFLNGRLVGLLRRQGTGAIDFQYDASWLNWEAALPISLSLPLRENRYVGAPVVAVFDNLLPDKRIYAVVSPSVSRRKAMIPTAFFPLSAATALELFSSCQTERSRVPWARSADVPFQRMTLPAFLKTWAERRWA